MAYIVPTTLHRGLGEMMEIAGTIIPAESMRKQFAGRIVIEVREVNGKKLDAPRILPLQWDGEGKEKLKINGTRASLRGYETAIFVGVPKQLQYETSKTKGLTQAIMFGVVSEFVVTSVLAIWPHE